MEWVNRYLKARYVDGGRGPDVFDCWGLVRQARWEHCAMRLLPEFGSLRNTDPRAFTKAYSDEACGMQLCEPEHGAIAAVMHGRICVHVALVVQWHSGQLWILEINPVRGARFLPLNKWRRDHNTVTYHRDAQ